MTNISIVIASTLFQPLFGVSVLWAWGEKENGVTGGGGVEFLHAPTSELHATR